MFFLLHQTKRKVSQDFWDELEAECANTGLVSKVPTCMKTILNACGYNNIWAFKSAEEGTIVDLERFMEKRHRKLIDSLDEYKDIQPFEFLPGHRSLILGIKNQIVSVEDAKRKRSMAKRKTKPSETLDEVGLKRELVDQMSDFSSKISLQIDWENAIDNFQSTTNGDVTSVQCSLLCPICGASRLIRFDESWKPSNMYKHLRSHVEEKQIKPSSRKSHKNQTSTTMADQNEAQPSIPNNAVGTLSVRSDQNYITIEEDNMIASGKDGDNG